jgi:hypothetical protein
MLLIFTSLRPPGGNSSSRQAAIQCWESISDRLRKILRSPFDKPVLSKVEGLRANGTSIKAEDIAPFVLRLSKHDLFAKLGIPRA